MARLRSMWINEIVWKRSDAHSDSNAYGKVHDTIYFYKKGEKNTWNQQYIPYSDDFIKTQYRYTEPDTGRRFRSADLSASGLTGGRSTYEWNGVTRAWRCTIETMRKYEAEGRLDYTGSGLGRAKSPHRRCLSQLFPAQRRRVESNGPFCTESLPYPRRAARRVAIGSSPSRAVSVIHACGACGL
jgi:hypothetical protein